MNMPLPHQERDARTWAAFCHLAAFAAFVMPLGHVIGPLVIWLVKRHEHPFVDDQGREAVNFQITVTMIFIGLAILFLLMAFLLLPAYQNRPMGALPLLGVGLAIPVIALIDFLLILIATIRSSNGDPYRYPFSIRFIPR